MESITYIAPKCEHTKGKGFTMFNMEPNKNAYINEKTPIALSSGPVLIKAVSSYQDILSSVEAIFEQTANLPNSKMHPILIKPNLNNDLIALSGNSTDLRLVAAVLSYLTKRDYKNIVVADGSNVGIDRKRINVLSRLKIERLCERYGAKCKNLNKELFREITLYNGERAKVADICFDSYLINLPKIKTHAEAFLSCACKNLMGCLAGGIEKKKMHAGLRDQIFSKWASYLGENIVSLNEQLKPDLNIVDGMIVMEGNGPGDGSPRKAGVILAGKDTFLLDLVVSKIVSFNYKDIPYLVVAEKKGYVTQTDIDVSNKLLPIINIIPPPKRRYLTKILGHNIFIKLRDTRRLLFDNKMVMPILYRYGIVQDLYEDDDGDFRIIKSNKGKCDTCSTKNCEAYCPVLCPISRKEFDFRDSFCIECLYCFFVCSYEEVQLRGNLGYLERHINRYKEKIRACL